MIEMRLRTRTSADELEAKKGKIPAPSDVNVLLTGPAKVLKPDGSVLCIYLPGAVADHMTDRAYDIFKTMESQGLTQDRGAASGTRRYKRPGDSKRTEAAEVSSAIVGSFDATFGDQKYCRLTAWTAKHLEHLDELNPLLRAMGQTMADHAPARWAAQMSHAARTRPEWLIPDTPFTTLTVNNTYPTGAHIDRGDLHDGLSTIAVLRRGEFTGGWINFPEFRVGVDLRHGDQILMDSHEYHANTAIVCACGRNLMRACKDCGAERVSVVAYFRTEMTGCGTFADEIARAQAVYDARAERAAAKHDADRAAGTPAAASDTAAAS